MKKILLSVLTLSSLASFGQWTITGNNSAEDCITFGSKVYASSTATNDSLRVSGDEGFSWSVSNTGIPAGTPISLATIHNNTLMVAFSKNTSKIYTSTNGSTWTAATTSAFGSDGISGICSIGGTTLVASVSSTSGKIYSSTNNGATWALLSTPAAGKLSTCIEYLNGSIYVGYNAAPKVLISTNGGSIFTPANTGISAADSYITALGNVGSNIFCGTYYGKIYKSTNAGTSWTQVHAITAATSFAHFINDFYTLGSDIFCATDTGFVYSRNLGVSWSLNNLGFNTGNFEHQLLKVTSTASYFEVACKGISGKIMRRQINEILAGIKENTLANIKSVVYPNPSSNYTTIEASELSNDNTCAVKVNDILGREIEIYKMENGKAMLNVSTYNKGIYTYNILKDKSVVGGGKLVVE